MSQVADLASVMAKVSEPSMSPISKASIIFSVVALLTGGSLIGHVADGRSNTKIASETAARGTLHPSKTQWDALTVAIVQALPFVDERDAEGAIAINDGSSAPVFSPYSGHVTKLFAKPGDVVDKGAPLMALETKPTLHGVNSEAVLHAPISGTIILRQVQLGEHIRTTSTGTSPTLFTIANISTVSLIANVRETDAPLMKIGTPVEIKALAWPDRVFKGKIVWIAKSLDAGSRHLKVRAEVDNRDGLLKPAMFGSIHLLGGTVKTVAGMPQSAIVYDGNRAQVFVAEKDGGLTLRPIRIGVAVGDMIEVTDGLSAGDKIVSGGTVFIDGPLENH